MIAEVWKKAIWRREKTQGREEHAEGSAMRANDLRVCQMALWSHLRELNLALLKPSAISSGSAVPVRSGAVPLGVVQLSIVGGFQLGGTTHVPEAICCGPFFDALLSDSLEPQ
jgi:hypothetical protein